MLSKLRVNLPKRLDLLHHVGLLLALLRLNLQNESVSFNVFYAHLANLRLEILCFVLFLSQGAKCLLLVRLGLLHLIRFHLEFCRLIFEQLLCVLK